MAALGRAIARRIGEPRYQLWFARNTKFSWDDDRLVVGVPNRFFQEWLQTTFADAVARIDEFGCVHVPVSRSLNVPSFGGKCFDHGDRGSEWQFKETVMWLRCHPSNSASWW